MRRKAFILTALMGSLMALGGCKGPQMDKAILEVAQIAPTGSNNAVDGYAMLTVKNLGKWRAQFVGLYKENGHLKADSILIEGMWIRYERAPFSRKIPEGEL